MDFLTEQNKNFTFQQINYLYTWLECLESTNFNMSPDNNPLLEFSRLMLTYNLNSIVAINYLTNELSNYLQPDTSPSERLFFMQKVFKLVRQISLIHPSGFQANRQSLKNELMQWIKVELDFLNALSIFSQNKELSQENESTNKIPTTLSVAQLALLIRLLSEGGIFCDIRKKTILEHFSRFFSTPNQETISYLSLKNKFYTPEPGAIEDLKQHLTNMTRIIQNIEM